MNIFESSVINALESSIEQGMFNPLSQEFFDRIEFLKKKEPVTQKLSNHDMILVALQPFKGQELSHANIKELVLARFPNFNPGSLQPNDHSQLGNKNCCRCVGTNRQLFINNGRSRYLVL